MNKNESEWWRDKRFNCEPFDYVTDGDGLDVPAIIAEAEKLERARVLEEVRKIVEEVQKEAEPMWSGDSVPFSHACSSILSCLESLDKIG